MEQDFPSKIELYYTEPSLVTETSMTIKGDEVKHISSVMRHSAGDELFVTDGEGNLYKTRIASVSKKEITAEIIEKTFYEKELPGVIFCLPRLKTADRFEFALEKCIELGITRFYVFDAENSVAKGDKIERWNKIALSAMKQSLRFYRPEIRYINRLNKLPDNLIPVLFEQEFKQRIVDFTDKNEFTSGNKKICFIFGPEGGLSENEMNFRDDAEKVSLTKNRLRAETAIITVAAIISEKK